MTEAVEAFVADVERGDVPRRGAQLLLDRRSERHARRRSGYGGAHRGGPTLAHGAPRDARGTLVRRRRRGHRRSSASRRSACMPHSSPDGRAANDALPGGALPRAAPRSAFTRYRSPGDTHPLFVGAGAARDRGADDRVRPELDPVRLRRSRGRPSRSPRSDGSSGGSSPASRSCSPGRGGIDAAAGRSRPGSSCGDGRRRSPSPDLLLIVFRHSLPHAKNVDLRRDGAFAADLARALDRRAAWRSCCSASRPGASRSRRATSARRARGWPRHG